MLCWHLVAGDGQSHSLRRQLKRRQQFGSGCERCRLMILPVRCIFANVCVHCVNHIYSCSAASIAHVHFWHLWRADCSVGSILFWCNWSTLFELIQKEGSDDILTGKSIFLNGKWVSEIKFGYRSATARKEGPLFLILNTTLHYTTLDHAPSSATPIH